MAASVPSESPKQAWRAAGTSHSASPIRQTLRADYQARLVGSPHKAGKRRSSPVTSCAGTPPSLATNRPSPRSVAGLAADAVMAPNAAAANFANLTPRPNSDSKERKTGGGAGSSSSSSTSPPLSASASLPDRFIPARAGSQVESGYDGLASADLACFLGRQGLPQPLHALDRADQRNAPLVMLRGGNRANTTAGGGGGGVGGGPAGEAAAAAEGGGAAVQLGQQPRMAAGGANGQQIGGQAMAAAAGAAAAPPLPPEQAAGGGVNAASAGAAGAAEAPAREGHGVLSMLLRSELDSDAPPRAPVGPSSAASAAGNGASAYNLLRFNFNPARQPQGPPEDYSASVTAEAGLLPLSRAAELLTAPRAPRRRVPRAAFKVLDAPALADDFYLNLVDWSSANVLAVGLGTSVYLWSAYTAGVTRLCEVGDTECVTSVAWTQGGQHLAVGTSSGEIQIWETCRCKKIRTLYGHGNRVGTMAWRAHILASGGRDRNILLRDVRAPQPCVARYAGHRQEVCGLKWSPSGEQLASGGNDNKLFVWSARSSVPLKRFDDHCAAVKALAWSPHQHGLLASGGGTADRHIRFYSTTTLNVLNAVDTGSQVCNLVWSKSVNEIVSTHGFSQHQIVLWRYPSMTKVATLMGHSKRVLYLGMSPDGQTVVTGAGDETLRFWNVFPGTSNSDGSRNRTSLLFPPGADVR